MDLEEQVCGIWFSGTLEEWLVDGVTEVLVLAAAGMKDQVVMIQAADGMKDQV